MLDYYKILGVEATAPPEEIKKAYREKAMSFHPDRVKNNKAESEEKFKDAAEAYEVLSDVDKRRSYDRARQPKNAQGRNGGMGFGYDFQSFFSFFQSQDIGNQISLDLEEEITITLEEAVNGCVKEIEVDRCEICSKCNGKGATEFVDCKDCQGNGFTNRGNSSVNFINPCPTCSRTGKMPVGVCAECSGKKYKILPTEKIEIKLPPGISPEHGVALKGKGHINPSSRLSGNLIIKLKYEKHDYFHKNGLDIYVSIPVTYTQLVFGGIVKVPLIEGGLNDLELPAGTFPGQPFRLWGRGFPQLNRPQTRGELVAIVKLDVPRDVSGEYKDLLEQLKGWEESNVCEVRQQYQELVTQRTSAH